MNAYIKTHKKIGADRVEDYYAEVVTEQDYHDGGPHAHSHKTECRSTPGRAAKEARQWAEKHGYQIVDGAANL